jgi:hypothetical protein
VATAPSDQFTKRLIANRRAVDDERFLSAGPSSLTAYDSPVASSAMPQAKAAPCTCQPQAAVLDLPETGSTSGRRPTSHDQHRMPRTP